MQHRAKPAMTPEQKQIINRALSAAVKAWDVDLIKGAVESGADPQELLAKAIAKKSPDMVKLSIQYGADVNALVSTGDRKFQPVIHYAHDNFNEEIFNIILQRGVRIDVKSAQGETLVQRAVRSGDFDRMRFYISKGGDLDGCAQEVLVKAIDKKDLAAIQWAVDNGADLHGRIRGNDDVMSTMLHHAYNNFREDVMEYMLKSLDIDARNSAGETVLQLAVRQPDSKKVDYLLKKGADPLAASYANVSILDEAMKSVAEEREYSSYSSRSKEGKAVMTLLLAKIKDVYGVEPYNTAMQRNITISKPIAVSPPKKNEDGPGAPR